MAISMVDPKQAVKFVDRIDGHVVDIECPGCGCEKLLASEQVFEVPQGGRVIPDLAGAKLHPVELQRLHLFDMIEHGFQGSGASGQLQLVASDLVQPVFEELIQLRQCQVIRRGSLV